MFIYLLLCLLLNFHFIQMEFLLDEAKKYGYIGELHNFETSDGFTIGLHRIYSRSYARSSKEIVFFVHGLIANSACFGYGGKTSLIHLLADRGFDVWLINARGNLASSKHRTLTEDDPAYWDYSLHEIGIIDVPQSIDYILRTTNRSNLNYVGHSQGGAVFGVLLSVLPEYNAKIKSACLLAPAFYISDSFPFMRPIANQELLNILIDLPKLMKFYGMRYNSEPWHAIMRLGIRTIPLSVINFWFYFVMGQPSGNNKDPEIGQLFALTTVDGFSFKQLAHFLQEWYTGNFQMYNYSSKNNEVYGSDKPPLYNLSNINVPINIFYGGNDNLVPATNVKRLIKKLGKNVVNEYFFHNWNHLEFVYPVNIKEILPKMLWFYTRNK